MFGAADMAADLGTALAWEPLAYARSLIVAACARCGAGAIDAPYFQMDDEAGLRVETCHAVAFGFRAKAAIHPSQIGVINDCLTPTETQLDRARLILAENAKGVGRVAGHMIDEAIARQARSMLAAAGLDG
jgi:(S)-citramalyl-CoA lyase